MKEKKEDIFLSLWEGREKEECGSRVGERRNTTLGWVKEDCDNRVRKGEI